MDRPVKNRIGGNFVPVREVAKAHDWYRGLLGLQADDHPLDGQHLSVIPLQGGGDLILDEMPMWRGDRPDAPPSYQTPAFMFDTDDVHAAHAHVRHHGGDLVTDVQESGEQGWFAFRDLDGNLLMVCGANPRGSNDAETVASGSSEHASGGIRLVESGPIHAVGLVATCAGSELSVVVPRLWGLLQDRLGDIDQRSEPGRQLSIFLGRRGEIFTELVGVAVREDAPTPAGMVRIDVPAGRYAAIHHRGPDVQASYRRVFDWADQQHLAVAPYEPAFHHIERYPEPPLQGELSYEIWVRLQATT
jgi:predicted transcriptional regulator YdeE/predicted enzyme related to lactoylglutathione lyase